MTDSTEPAEGWGVIRDGDRRAHYYRKMFSLCGKVGFYVGPLDPDEFTSKQDCAACRKKLTKEQEKEKAAADTGRRA